MSGWAILLLLSLTLGCVLGEINILLVERCCSLGSQWAQDSGGRCPPYPTGELYGVRSEAVESCTSLVDICCGQTARSQQCDMGRDIARSDRSCEAIKVVRANLEAYTYRKECCQCCQLGMLAAESTRGCEMFERSGRICDEAPECCEAFYTCCNSTQVYANPVSTTTTTTITTTTTTTTTTQEPDVDVEPVHKPGGICAKFSTALCEHYCHDAPNRRNQFRCSCRRGYELKSNQRNCMESEIFPTCETHNSCDSSAECYMRGGVPLCRCASSGYRLSGGSRCEDIDECVQGLDTCTGAEKCENTPGGFICNLQTCSAGTAYDPLSAICVPVTGPRITNTASCGRGEIYDYYRSVCVSDSPADGNCPRGYTYNQHIGTCEDVDECSSDTSLHNCTGNLPCRNVPGYFLCECALGMALNFNTGLCEDVDECAIGQDDCEVGQRCENTPGSYQCRRDISCGTGYTLQESTQICIDINECQLSTHNCGPAFTCRNIPGSFRCDYRACPPGQRLDVASGACSTAVSCRPGFSYDEFTRQCQDVNECLTENPCLRSETCTNTEGSYRCIDRTRLKCYNGYELNDAGTSCRDINECETGQHTCESRDACQNTQGSYNCKCGSGFAIDSVTNICKDIDECSRAVGQYCSPLNSVCVNTPGSFYCQCKEGFESIVNGKACQDINECEPQNPCDHTCHNVWGTYQCRCRPGFRLAEDKKTCTDLNECALSTSRGRLCNGFCENVPGSFRCICPPGFRLSENQRECIDIDECSEGSAGCTGQNHVCMNTRGSYKCSVIQCPRYFSLSTEGLSRAVDDGAYCYKRCPAAARFDINCYLNTTSVVSYHFLSLPTIADLDRTITLFTLDSSSDTVYPNVLFEIISGNDDGVFQLTKEGVYRGSLVLIKPISGPREFTVQLLMEASDLNNVIVTSQIAVINVVVSPYLYEVIA